MYKRSTSQKIPIWEHKRSNSVILSEAIFYPASAKEVISYKVKGMEEVTLLNFSGKWINEL